VPVSEDDRHARRLQALAESGMLFAEATPDLARLLNLVAKRFAELVGDGCNLRLIEGDQLVPMATYHPDPEVQRYLREFHDATPLKVGVGISGRVLETGDPYFEPALDLATFQKSTTPAFAEVFERIGITGMIVARLRARGVNLGYLGLFRNGPGPRYTLEDLALVQDLAERAALAIDNARLLETLERRVDERTRELEIRNRELEAFAFSVSHDLRSPLRAIEGFSQVLEEDHADALPADAKRTLGVIRKNTTRMTKLVDDLLRLSRLGARAIEPISELETRAIVDAIVSQLVETEARPIELRLGELPKAMGNADLMQQVWMNLVGNAVKYSRKKPQTIVEIAGVREAGEVRFTITDHGAGFDPTYADKLFGVFQRLHSDADFEGTGVGLALVQRIVSRHGGRVWAEGRPGLGATFGFSLPDHPQRK
jgi:signal transduction histidine kinase